MVVTKCSSYILRLNKHSLLKCRIADWFSLGQHQAQPVCFDERISTSLILCETWAFYLLLSTLIQNKLLRAGHNSPGGLQKVSGFKTEYSVQQIQAVNCVCCISLTYKSMFMLFKYNFCQCERHHNGVLWNIFICDTELLCTVVRWSSHYKSDPSQILNQKRRLNFFAANTFLVRP